MPGPLVAAEGKLAEAGLAGQPGVLLVDLAVEPAKVGAGGAVVASGTSQCGSWYCIRFGDG